MLAPDFVPCQGGVGVYISELIRHFPPDVNIHILTPKRIDNNFLLKVKNNLTLINFPKILLFIILEKQKIHFYIIFLFRFDVLWRYQIIFQNMTLI